RDAVGLEMAGDLTDRLMAYRAVRDQDRGIGTVFPAAAQDLRCVGFARHALAAVGGSAVEAREGTDAAPFGPMGGDGAAEGVQREVAALVFAGRVLEVDGDVVDAEVVLLSRVAGIGGEELARGIVAARLGRDRGRCGDEREAGVAERLRQGLERRALVLGPAIGLG